MWWKKKLDKIDREFIRKGAEKMSDKEVSQALENEEKIKDKITKSGLLQRYLQIVRLMLSMLNDYRKGHYKNVPWLTISALVFMILYVLNPLDLIPDFIPLIGYLDDITVLALGLNLIETDLHKYIRWKANAKTVTAE